MDNRDRVRQQLLDANLILSDRLIDLILEEITDPADDPIGTFRTDSLGETYVKVRRDYWVLLADSDYPPEQWTDADMWGSR